jgi:hypothetical protein
MSMIGTEEAQRKAAQAQIASDLMLSRAGRSGQIDQDRLGVALGTASRSSEGLFADYVSYAKDYAQTVNAIGELYDISDAALSIEEQALQAQQDQLDRLEKNHAEELAYYDNLLASGKSILDALNGNDVTVQSILDAIRGFNKASGAAGGGNLTLTGTNGGTIDAESFAAFRQSAEDSSAISKAYQEILNRTPDLAGMVYWEQVAQAGTAIADIVEAIRNSDEAKRGIAINGSHATGLNYVPYDGYIAELHRGERIQTAEEARISRMVRASNGLGVGAGGDGGAVERLLNRLITAVEAGNDANELALAQNTEHAQKTADGIQRMTNVGVVSLSPTA